MTTSIEGSGARPTRRDLLQTAAATAALGLTGAATAQAPRRGPRAVPAAFNQSVCRWCYGKISLEDLCSGGEANGPGRHRPAQSLRLSHAQEARPDLHHDQLSSPEQRPCRPQVPGRVAQDHQHGHRGDGARGLEERDLLLGQPPRHRRQDGHGQLRQGPARDRPGRREGECHPQHGAAQQQGRPPRLHVRSLSLGHRAGQAGWLRQLPAAL